MTSASAPCSAVRRHIEHAEQSGEASSAGQRAHDGRRHVQRPAAPPSTSFHLVSGVPRFPATCSGTAVVRDRKPLAGGLLDATRQRQHTQAAFFQHIITSSEQQPQTSCTFTAHLAPPALAAAVGMRIRSNHTSAAASMQMYSKIGCPPAVPRAVPG